MSYLAFLAIGRLIIWTIQTSSLLKRVWSRDVVLTELVTCDFCLGFWVFFALSVALGYNGFDDLQLLYYPIGALISSFVTHLFALGWRSKFGTTIIE